MARLLKISAELLGDEKFISLLGRLSNQDANKAIKSGVAYAARSTKVVVSKGLRSGGLNLASGEIKKDVKPPKFRMGGLSAEVDGSYDPRTARAYKGKQNAKGIGVTFYKGKRETVPRAFYAKGLPFARITEASDSKLRVIHGPSIAAAYLNGSKSGQIKAAVEKNFEDKLEFGINRRLSAFLRGF